MSPTEASTRTIILGAILGITATVLTYGHAIGLGFTIFVVLLLSALVFNARMQQVKPARQNMFIVIPLLFFAVMLTVRSDELLTMLNLGAGVIAASLLVYFFNTGSIAQQSIFNLPVKVMVGSTAPLVQPLEEVNHARQWLTTHRGIWRHATPVARGALLMTPVVGVFVVLLGSADQVFADVIDRIVRSLIPQNTFDLTAKTAYFLFFAWIATGGQAFALLERKIKQRPTLLEEIELEEPGAASISKPIISLGFTETIMMLGGVAAVFVLFVGIQFVYLFGGEHNITNFSYADYARRGFAELVAVGVLTLGLAFTLSEISVRQTKWREKLFRYLTTLLFILTGVILASAFLRLRLYEMTYGFTALRLAVYVAIVWLGFLFAGFTLSLYWRPQMINVFGMTVLIAFFGSIATLDVLNPDAFVAWQNIHRGDIDPLYLRSLSEEAVPALITLVDAPEPGLRSVIREALSWQQTRLAYFSGDWREFNLGRSNALAALATVQDKLADSIALSHDIAEFEANLRKGQTVRATVRQFGTPYYTTDSNYTERSRGTIVLTYLLEDGSTLHLDFDTAQGLWRACLNSNSDCLSLQ